MKHRNTFVVFVTINGANKQKLAQTNVNIIFVLFFHCHFGGAQRMGKSAALWMHYK